MNALELVNTLLETEDIDWTPDPSDPDDVTDTSAALPQRFSSVRPSSEGTAPLRVTLRQPSRYKRDEWVTHIQNLQTGGYSSGNYFMGDYDAAVRDYEARCRRYKVEPL